MAKFLKFALVALTSFALACSGSIDEDGNLVESADLGKAEQEMIMPSYAGADWTDGWSYSPCDYGEQGGACIHTMYPKDFQIKLDGTYQGGAQQVAMTGNMGHGNKWLVVNFDNSNRTKVRVRLGGNFGASVSSTSLDMSQVVHVACWDAFQLPEEFIDDSTVQADVYSCKHYDIQYDNTKIESWAAAHGYSSSYVYKAASHWAWNIVNGLPTVYGIRIIRPNGSFRRGNRWVTEGWSEALSNYSSCEQATINQMNNWLSVFTVQTASACTD